MSDKIQIRYQTPIYINGIGITDMVINGSGELVITTSDDVVTNLGVVVGQDGVNGNNGIDGTNGIDGADGADGSNGIDGADGVDGTDGVDGVDLTLEVGGVKTVLSNYVLGFDEYDLQIDTVTDKTEMPLHWENYKIATSGEDYFLNQTPSRIGSYNASVYYTQDKTKKLSIVPVSSGSGTLKLMDNNFTVLDSLSVSSMSTGHQYFADNGDDLVLLFRATNSTNSCHLFTSCDLANGTLGSFSQKNSNMSRCIFKADGNLISYSSSDSSIYLHTSANLRLGDMTTKTLVKSAANLSADFPGETFVSAFTAGHLACRMRSDDKLYICSDQDNLYILDLSTGVATFLFDVANLLTPASSGNLSIITDSDDNMIIFEYGSYFTKFIFSKNGGSTFSLKTTGLSSVSPNTSYPQAIDLDNDLVFIYCSQYSNSKRLSIFNTSSESITGVASSADTYTWTFGNEHLNPSFIRQNIDSDNKKAIVKNTSASNIYTGLADSQNIYELSVLEPGYLDGFTIPAQAHADSGKKNVGKKG